MNRKLTREIFQRLRVAERRTREAYQKVIVGDDLHEGSQIAQMWPFITAGYCGIEQSFKFLIARRKGLRAVRQLLEEEKPSRRRSAYQTHDLRFLYRKLDPTEQCRLSDDYRRFTSLHDYIVIASLTDFLEIVSSDDGNGYVSWRYSLTDCDTILPTNSAEALLAVWTATIHIVRDDVYERATIRTIEHSIVELFSSHLDQMLSNVSAERQNDGFGYEDYTAEYDSWVKQFDDPLNAFSRVIHDFYRGLAHEVSGTSEQLAEALRRWLQWIHAEVRNRETSPDVRQFVTRALGARGNAQGIRWNKDRHQFEDVSWTLDELVAREPPDGACAFKATWDDWRQHRVINWIYSIGFHVEEHRPYREHMPPGKWLCTLSATKTWANGQAQVIRLWEHADPDEEFYVELAGSDDSDEARKVRQCIAAWAQQPQIKAEWLPIGTSTES